MRRYQFSLRQLLLLTAVLCSFLGWWFKPFVVEETLYNGLMTIKYRVRRHWDGARYHYGPVRMFYWDGTMASEAVIYDAKVGSVDRFVGGDARRFWSDDGTEVSFEEWFVFMSDEYCYKVWGQPETEKGTRKGTPKGDIESAGINRLGHENGTLKAPG